MRDLFALASIAFAVIALGVFRVPDGDGLQARGIAADARAALYQSTHPLDIDVTRRSVTVSGRVDSDAERLEVLRILRGLEGVEQVRDQLTVLPTVTPFVLTLNRNGMASGNVPDAEMLTVLSQVLQTEPPELSLAAGVPDATWGDVVLRGAQALMQLTDGQLQVADRVLSLTGTADLPATTRAVIAELNDLPPGYSAVLKLSARDDGLPYALSIARDARLGQRISGKLPPDTDLAMFDVLGPAQQMTAVQGPVALHAPGFEQAMALALPVFAHFDEGSLTIAPRVVSISGGPVDDALWARVTALPLPPDWRLETALVPVDDGVPLALRVVWDGAKLTAQGKVPSDLDLSLLGESADLVVSPFPDLVDWAAPLPAGIAALQRLTRGQLTLDDTGLHLNGVAENPTAQERVLTALGNLGKADITLQDDGVPPRIVLTTDVVTGAAISGKLPMGITVAQIAQLTGLPLTQALPQSPAGSDTDLRTALSAVAPWTPVMDRWTLTHDDETLTIDAVLTPGAPLDRIGQLLRLDLPRTARLTLATGPAPLNGTSRVNVLIGQLQVFRSGWLPVVGFDPSPAACRKAAVPDIGFEPGSLRFAPLAVLALNETASLLRACTRLAGLRATLQAAVTSADSDALNTQLARRRAAVVRDALTARGVAAQTLTALETPAVGNRDQILVWFDDS